MPEVIEGMPGTFLDPDTKRLRWIRNHEHEQMLAARAPGLPPHRVYYADVKDGALRCFTSQDPAEEGGAWRMSVMHLPAEGPFCRLPTWDEFKHARYSLIPRGVHMAILLPGKVPGLPDDGYVNANDWVLQAAEVTAECFV